MSNQTLYLNDKDPWNIGSTRYYPDYDFNRHNLNLAVYFTMGENLPSHIGMLDTASTWVVLNRELVEGLDIEIDEAPILSAKIHTRFV